MAKIGSMELIVILIVAMLAIGPERMPKAARTLGKASALKWRKSAAAGSARWTRPTCWSAAACGARRSSA